MTVLLENRRHAVFLPQSEDELFGIEDPKMTRIEDTFPNVVFSNGWLERPGGALWIYYGAADESIAVARTSVEDLLGCFDEST